MSKDPQRYSKLRPLTLDERVFLSSLAVLFFSPTNYRSMCEQIGKQVTSAIQPLDGRDFLNYLKKTQQLSEPDRYMYRINELLHQLENARILTKMGQGKDVFVGTQYYCLREQTKQEQKSLLWLAPAIGPDFIQSVFAPATLQINGADKNGDTHAGTGIAIAPEWILTCAHVLTDMKVNETQMLNGCEYKVVGTLPHDNIDVGLIKVASDVQPANGIAFRDPVIAETVFTLGYPRIPLSLSPALVMQRGEIISSSVSLLSGREVFLYSAIARPGNSGGPIISCTGQVVGLVTEQLTERSLEFRSPFYAGIRTSEIARAISELEPSVALPIEDYQ